MDSTLSKPKNWLMLLRELIDRGLWPYTADPVPTGLHVIGEPPPDTPLILEGNSRHALGRLRRSLGEGGGRVLLLDTGGLDLYRAVSAGRLEQEMVLSALPSSEAQAEDGAPANSKTELEDGAVPLPHLEARTLLAYPVWEAHGGEALLEAADIAAGPASPEALPAFLDGGALDQPLRERRVSPRERLHLVLAHAGLLLLPLIGLLLFVEWIKLLIGAALLLLAAVAVWFLPALDRRVRRFSCYRSWLPLVLVAAIAGLLAGIASAIAGLSGPSVWLLAIGAIAETAWLGVVTRVDLI